MSCYGVIDLQYYMQMRGSQADFQKLKHFTFTLSINANPDYFRRRLNVYSISVVCLPCKQPITPSTTV